MISDFGWRISRETDVFQQDIRSGLRLSPHVTAGYNFSLTEFFDVHHTELSELVLADIVVIILLP